MRYPSWLKRWFLGWKRPVCEKRRLFERRQLTFDVLESRITPAGHGVVFLVNGYAGAQIPNDVDQHLVNDLITNSGIPKADWNVYVTNWNSPDPTTTSGFPGEFPNANVSLKDPSLYVPIEVLHKNILGVDVPVGYSILPVATPDPVSPEPFITNLTNILETQYDNQDFIALIGHSLGGASLLEVANRLGAMPDPRKIDLLATLDPVGFSNDISNGDSVNVVVTDGLSLGGQQIIQPISFNIPVNQLQGAIDPNFHDPVRGYPGWGNALVGPNQGNVKYFYNRYQTNFPFPFDRSFSRDFQNIDVQQDVSQFTYLGDPIQEQAVANTQLYADGSVNDHYPSFLDVVYGYSHLQIHGGSFDPGDPFHLDKYGFPDPILPSITLPTIDFTRTSVQNHASLPLDGYIEGQLNTILDNIVPQKPTASAVARDSHGNIITNINEGQVVTLDASGSTDPNPGDAQHLTYHWEQTGGPYDVTLSDANSPTPTFTAGRDSGGNKLSFKVTVTDPTDLSDSTKVKIIIDNVAPTAIRVNGPNSSVIGYPISYSGTYSDPGITNDPATTDHFTYFFKAVDSHNVTVAFTSGGSLNFTPTAPGTYTVYFTVTDAAGDFDTTSKTVTVKLAGLIPDPADSSKQALAVGIYPGGTHTITLKGPSNAIDVTIDNVDQGTFAPTGQIIVVGNSGTDNLVLDFSAGNLLAASTGLLFDGGGGSNSLNLKGGAFINEVETPSSSTSGNIVFDSFPAIKYKHVSMVYDTVPISGTATFNGAGADDTISLGNGGTVNLFQTTQLSSGRFATFDFAEKPHVVVQDSGVDTFYINMTPATVAADLQTLKVVGTAGTGGDTFNVQATAVPTELDGGGMSDAFIVSSDAGVNSPPGGNLFGIQGELTLVGGSDTGNLLQVSDAGNMGTTHFVTMTSSSISGFAPATINYSALGGGAFDAASNGGIILQGSNVNGPGSLYIVQSTLAGSSTEVYGGSGDDDFAITASGLGDNSSNSFFGQNGDDYFSIIGAPPANASLKVFGGGGTNTLKGPDLSNSWDITGDNAGDIAGVVNTFNHIQNLIGGTQDDAFQFSDNVGVSGTVNGRDGTNTLDYSLYAANHPITVNLQDQSATNINGGNASGFSHIQNLVGGAGFDTLIGANSANTWNISGQDTGDVNGFTFSAIENLTGGTAQDDFVFADHAGIDGMINGQGGHDFLDYSAYLSPITVNLTTGLASHTAGVMNVQNVIGSAVGGDHLAGNLLGNILVAHNKGNVLTGGSGRSLLIGGFGKNSVRGGKGGNLLIDGKTSFDSDIAALSALFAEWQSHDSYSVRLSKMRSGAGLAAGNKLIVGKTVFEPQYPNGVGPRLGRGGGNVASTLIGGSGLNWFFCSMPSLITDLKVGVEKVN